MEPPNNFYRALVGLVFGLSGYLFVAKPAFDQRRSLAESVGSSASTVTLGGWVRADYGPGAPGGVTVRLETNEGLIGGEQPVNTSGYFEFVGLAKTYYRLMVTAPGFPAQYKAEAEAGSAFLDLLRQEKDLSWTFISPSALFVEGERTGKFRLGTDQLLADASGKSWITFADYAIALADEIERPAHVRQRLTVGY